MKLSLLALSLALFALSGCAITAHTPLTRFESPEVQGEFLRAEGFLAYQGRNEISFTPDFTTTPPNLSNGSIEEPDHRLMAQAAVSLGRRFDLSVNGPGARIGGKFQLTGEPAISSEQGNVPISIYGGGTLSRENQTDRDGLAGANSPERRFNLRELQFDIGLVAGLRLAPQVLIYGGPFIYWNRIRARYAPSVGAAETEEQATARVFNANIGMEINFGTPAYARIEYAGALTSIRSRTGGRGTYGFAFGARF
ncbi:MAG: hypothetical protein EOP11_13250 [Proteobacteria bacterium]|nr:MAG: hypothetical protein EOP11_13250 [Pseudomonadota bacterium]